MHLTVWRQGAMAFITYTFIGWLLPFNFSWRFSSPSRFRSGTYACSLMRISPTAADEDKRAAVLGGSPSRRYRSCFHSIPLSPGMPHQYVRQPQWVTMDLLNPSVPFYRATPGLPGSLFRDGLNRRN